MTNLVQHQTYVAPENHNPAPLPHVSAREHTSAYALEVNDGRLTEREHINEKGSVNEVNPYFGTDSIFSTAMHPRGLPVLHIADDTLLTLPDGMQATAKSLATLGVITQNPDGTYSDKPVEAQEEQEEVNPDVMPLADREMAVIQQTLASVGPNGVSEGEVLGLLATAAGVATGRLDATKLASQWARVAGDGSEGKLEQMKAVFQAQADRGITKMTGLGGDDLGAFYAWAKAHHREQLGDAISKQVHTADLSGYKALATRYMNQTGPSEQALRAAGVPVRKGGLGLECYVAGMWQSPASAARAGFL